VSVSTLQELIFQVDIKNDHGWFMEDLVF
jgi:hypothetical protein